VFFKFFIQNWIRKNDEKKAALAAATKEGGEG